MTEEAAPAMVVLGNEYDDDLRRALMKALSELGAVKQTHDWGIGGSQEVETLEIRIGGELLVVEAETYIGLTLTGPRDLVDQVKSAVERLTRR